MKLKDVFDAAGDRTDWVKFFWDYYISENGTICPLERAQASMDSEVEIVYYWFDHLNPDVDMDEIDKAIQTHDYETFYKWFVKLLYEKYNYLTSSAFIYIEGECVGEIFIADSPDMFSLITCSEHKCG